MFHSQRLSEAIHPSIEVIPIKDLLRQSWNSSAFLRGTMEVSKPLLLADDGSKAHLGRLNDIMGSDYDWALIHTLSLLGQEAELIGSWCEGCSCHPPPSRNRRLPQVQDVDYSTSIVSLPPGEGHAQRRRPKQRASPMTKAEREAAACCFRCCRAPELATGHALVMQGKFSASHQSLFNSIVANLSITQRGELIAYWTFASSKLFGILAALRRHSLIYDMKLSSLSLRFRVWT